MRKGTQHCESGPGGAHSLGQSPGPPAFCFRKPVAGARQSPASDAASLASFSTQPASSLARTAGCSKSPGWGSCVGQRNSFLLWPFGGGSISSIDANVLETCFSLIQKKKKSPIQLSFVGGQELCLRQRLAGQVVQGSLRSPGHGGGVGWRWGGIGPAQLVCIPGEQLRVLSAAHKELGSRVGTLLLCRPGCFWEAGRSFRQELGFQPRAGTG